MTITYTPIKNLTIDSVQSGDIVTFEITRSSLRHKVVTDEVVTDEVDTYAACVHSLGELGVTNERTWVDHCFIIHPSDCTILAILRPTDPNAAPEGWEIVTASDVGRGDLVRVAESGQSFAVAVEFVVDLCPSVNPIYNYIDDEAGAIVFYRTNLESATVYRKIETPGERRARAVLSRIDFPLTDAETDAIRSALTEVTAA